MLKQLLFVLFSPRGRIRRNQFWIAWVLVLLLGFGLNQAQRSLGGVLYLGVYCYLVFSIYGKRLHDLSKSAWFIVWPGAAQAVGWGLSLYLIQSAFSEYGSINDLEFASALGFAPVIIWTIFAFYVGLPQGFNGDNRFGPDPRQQELISSAPGLKAET